MSDFVRVEKPRPHVALVTLNRPERMNAMAFDVMVPFREELERVAGDNDVRAVVVTGEGRGFCSGADLVSAGSPPGIAGLQIPSIARRSMKLLEDVVTTMRLMHQPVIGAINGASIGGGFCLALACDIRVGSTEAYFRAAEIMLTGRDVDATEAERIGLVSSVVAPDALLDTCFDLGERIAAFSHVGVQLTKQTLRSGQESGFHAHMEHEGLGQLYVRLLTKNFEEAILARKEKRPAEFTDS